MSLNLPANFAADITGRDTSLIPVVVIGNLFPEGSPEWNKIAVLSTNVLSINIFKEFGGELDVSLLPVELQTSVPLLLNIPSLKESIDIEKRNYKISSVNLDISNFSYNGQRFSELIADMSLINTECRIFWVSPSTTHIIPMDHGPFTNPTNGGVQDYWAFQIFNGSIRRYTHDDEKVRLVVEDRSQATLHRDLPLPDSYLSVDIGTKDAGKAIPMVYGHVDRSPCVMKATEDSLDLDNENTILIKSAEIIIDSVDVANNLNTGTFEGTQKAVSGLFIEDSDTYLSVPQNSELEFGTKAQWEVESSTSPRILLVPLIKGTNEADNFIADGNVEIVDVNWAAKMSIRTDSIDYTAGSQLLTNRDLLLDNDNNTSMVSGEYLHYPTASNGDGFVGFYLMFDPPPYNASNRYSRNVQNWLLQKFDTGIMSNGDYDDYVVRVNDTPLHFIDEFIANGDTASGRDNLMSGNLYTWQIWDNTVDELKLFYWTTGTDDFSPFSTSVPEINYYRVGVLRHVVIEQFTNKVFYADVNGRNMDGNDSPTAPSVIKEILSNELGQGWIEEPLNTSYDDWRYAFTINKKIGSKSLLEGIASASPFLPRFTNTGEFKFDVIPELYSQPNHTIKESDVIDFSFSRTKIEDVCTKIILKYNWDYARKEFNDTFSMYISPGNGMEAEPTQPGNDWDTLPVGTFLNYDYNYYGLKLDDSESTLVIDDERGKYIRELHTAQEFAKWLLLFNMNQHLKMKVKLPLRYMNIEIGDELDFDKVINNVKPYGIDYGRYSSYTLNDVNYYGDQMNASQIYPSFIVTSTNKTLEWVEIEVLQLHNLTEVGQHGSICEEPAVFDECGVCGGDNSACIDECGVPNGEGYYECWDGEEVCDSEDCTEATGNGICIVDGVNLGETTYEECLGEQVGQNNFMGKDIPTGSASLMNSNKYHLNSDGTLLYNISPTTAATFTGFYLMIIQEEAYTEIADNEVYLQHSIPPISFCSPFQVSDGEPNVGRFLLNDDDYIPDHAEPEFWLQYDEDCGLVTTEGFGVNDMGGGMYNLPPNAPPTSNVIFIYNQFNCTECGPQCEDDELYDCSTYTGGVVANPYNGELYTANSGVLLIFQQPNFTKGYIVNPYVGTGTPEWWDHWEGCDSGANCPPCWGCEYLEPYTSLTSGVTIDWTQSVNFTGSGDLNLDGKTDIADIVLMGNYLSGDNDLDNKQLIIADILRTNNVSILDIVNLANMIVGGTYNG